MYDDTKSKFATVTGSTGDIIATAAGGALLGSSICGPLGTIVGALSGATVSVVASTIKVRRQRFDADVEDEDE